MILPLNSVLNPIPVGGSPIWPPAPLVFITNYQSLQVYFYQLFIIIR